ncbi:hypothetical protein [Streptomyces roseicoloratus]|uniref:hypothetical protein n=1 Tax=Streptomyces roseicoloratus TaxID=2508722 RepID=UPI0013E9841E|nr:hypothetical protein [Streptomyces roseicoloratus]
MMRVPDPLAEIRTRFLRHASHLDPQLPLRAPPYEKRRLAYDETVAAAADSPRAAETS